MATLTDFTDRDLLDELARRNEAVPAPYRWSGVGFSEILIEIDKDHTAVLQYPSEILLGI